MVLCQWAFSNMGMSAKKLPQESYTKSYYGGESPRKMLLSFDMLAGGTQ